MDQEICEDEHTSGELLIQRDFNLPEWYANKCVLQVNQPLPPGNRWTQRPLMGDTMQWKLTQIILNSNEYPAYPMIPLE
jgi:hypothetical protein